MGNTLKRLAFCIAGAGLLTVYGCGGGSGGGGTGSGSAGSATPTSILVTASLGKFSTGTPVKLTRPDQSQLAAGAIGGDGTAALSFSGYNGPLVVEVHGGAGVMYWDDGQMGLRSFAAGRKLRAVIAAPVALVGVTALTNAAAVKLDAAPGGIAGASAGAIQDANANVAAAFGLPNILEAPTPVDGSSTNTLKLGVPGDKYALVLAALAKTATGANTAADVADAVASDLKDGKLDNQDGATSLPAYSPAALPAKYQEAASELAETASQMLAALQPLVINSGVSIAPTGSDLDLAKAMFGELRTTLNAFANRAKTGFLDTQAQRARDDLNANVAPELIKLADRVGTIDAADGMFNDGRAYTPAAPNGLVPGAGLLAPFSSALVRVSGSLNAVWSGYGSYDHCWTDAASGVTAKVTCAHAGTESADRANNRIKLVVVELTGTAANQYTYTAAEYTMPVSVTGLGFLAIVLQAGPIVDISTPTTRGSGTASKSVAGSTVTGFSLNGSFPPSTTSTGPDLVAISVARTALAAEGSYRYAVAGSVSTANLADSSKVVTVDLASGSFLDVGNVVIPFCCTQTRLVAAKLVGSAKTVATTFTGTLDLGSFMGDAVGYDYSATSMLFDGSVIDTSPGGAGQVLSGKLYGAISRYNQYRSFLPSSPTNYLNATLTFTGTVQLPARPLLTLVFAAAATGPDTTSVAVNYSYGTQSITGTGTLDNATPAGDSMTLSNQNGIQVVTITGAVTRAGVTLATIANDLIHYVDGVTESLLF